jgi:hypothetical protein
VYSQTLMALTAPAAGDLHRRPYVYGNKGIAQSGNLKNPRRVGYEHYTQAVFSELAKRLCR